MDILMGLISMGTYTFEWQEELFNYANDLSIDCISTPFDETAVDLLEDIGTKFEDRIF